MRRLLRVGGLLIALLPAPVGRGRAADLDMAFVGTLSGSTAAIAQDELDGFRLAVRHLGGGDRLGGVEFSLAVVDDQRNSDVARQAVDSLWQAGHLRVLLLSSTAATVTLLAPMAAAHRTLILNLGQVSAAIAGRDCSANFFSLVVRGGMLHELDGQYLQGQGYRRVAVFEPDRGSDALSSFRRDSRVR